MMNKLDETAGSQETPVGNKEGTSAKQVLRLSLGAAISFLIATFVLGYALGKNKSPDWEDPVRVSNFIADNCTKQFVVASGRQPLPESDPIELRLRVRERDYVYRTDTDEITPELLPVRDRQALPKHKMQSKDNQSLMTAAGALGTSAAGLLANVRVSLNWLGKVRNGKIVGAAAAAAVLGVGGFYGYYMGFRGEPDYSSKMFQEMLRDKVVWRGLATQYRSDELHRLRAEAAPSATP
jgi:hypothetical protein